MSTNTNFSTVIQQATTNLRIDRHALDDMIEIHQSYTTTYFRHMRSM